MAPWLGRRTPVDVHRISGVVFAFLFELSVHGRSSLLENLCSFTHGYGSNIDGTDSPSSDRGVATTVVLLPRR